MSTELWDDERLDRLAAISENNARTAANHERLIESNARAILALVNATAEAREERDLLFERMDRMQANIDQMQANIERQQAEIVGLRTETNRLLDLLLNQRNQGDNPSN